MTDENTPMLPAEQTDRQPDGALWDVDDVAAYLKVSESTIRRRIAEQSIPFRRIGGLVRFVPDEVRRWVDEAA